MLSRIRSAGPVAFILLALVVVIGVILFTVHTIGTLKTPALIVVEPVAAGQVVTSQDVHVVDLGLGGQSVNLMSSLPPHALAATPLNPGELLQQNDLVTSAQAEIEIAMQHSPTLVAGDTIDIYVDTNASNNSNGTAPTASSPPNSGSSSSVLNTPGVVLIGVGVPVTAVDGAGELTILAPMAEATAWAAISATQPDLVAVVATTQAPPSVTNSDLNAALNTLQNQVAALGSGASTTSNTAFCSAMNQVNVLMAASAPAGSTLAQITSYSKANFPKLVSAMKSVAKSAPSKYSSFLQQQVRLLETINAKIQALPANPTNQQLQNTGNLNVVNMFSGTQGQALTSYYTNTCG